jgi:hypothetical protein
MREQPTEKSRDEALATVSPGNVSPPATIGPSPSPHTLHSIGQMHPGAQSAQNLSCYQVRRRRRGTRSQDRRSSRSALRRPAHPPQRYRNAARRDGGQHREGTELPPPTVGVDNAEHYRCRGAMDLVQPGQRHVPRDPTRNPNGHVVQRRGPRHASRHPHRPATAHPPSQTSWPAVNRRNAAMFPRWHCRSRRRCLLGAGPGPRQSRDHVVVMV